MAKTMYPKLGSRSKNLAFDLIERESRLDELLLERREYSGVIFGVFQVTTVPDEGENSFKMPRASVVHMTSTATRPQHMSQVSTHASSKSRSYYRSFTET